jgi:hypothetical protein
MGQTKISVVWYWSGAEPFTRLRRAVAQVKKINNSFFF